MSNTALATAQRLLDQQPADRLLPFVPPGEPGSGNLSHGVVVEASLLARLFRMKLLTVDATIVLMPSAPAESNGPVTVAAGPLPSPAEPPVAVPRRADHENQPAIGSSLRDAERLIDESDRELRLLPKSNRH